MRGAALKTDSMFVSCIKIDEANLLQSDGSYAGRIGSLHAMWFKAGRNWAKVLENHFHAEASRDPNRGFVTLARLGVLIATDWLAVELHDKQAEALKEAVSSNPEKGGA